MLRGLNIYIGYVAFGFGASLVFSTKIANVALFIFLLLIIINYSVKKNVSFKIDNAAVLKFSVLLLLVSTILSLFFFQDYENVLKAFGKRLSYFFTPFIFLLLDKKTINLVKQQSLKGLVLGSVVSSLFLILNIFYEYFLTRPIFTIDKQIFNFYHTGRYFTRVLDIHPSYFGMYLLLALLYVFFKKGKKSLVSGVSFFLVITLTIFFLNSRIIIGLFILLNSFFIVSNLFKQTKSVYKTILLASLVFMSCLSILFMLKKTYAYQRVFKESGWELSYEIGSNYNYIGSGDSRLARWDAAIKIIKESPFLGYGVFNERESLVRQYTKMKMYSAAKQNYNAHNQYLGFFIEGGIFSMVALLFYFYFNLVFSVRRKNIISFFFFICILFICLVENFLIRNAGIIFISFFGTLFLYENYVID